jgi:thiol-disulfide isomerase/thioredoxin
VSRREIALLLAVALLAGLVGLGLGIARNGPGPLAATPLGQWLERLGQAGTLGDPAPRFTVTGFDGRPRTLPESGRAVLVNYWASWCGPCRRELPLLNAFAAEQGSNGVQVVGIALEDPHPARAFLATVPVAYATAWEAPGLADSSVRLGNSRGVLPFSVLVDAQGRIRARRIGAFTDAADLRAWVDQAGVARK